MVLRKVNALAIINPIALAARICPSASATNANQRRAVTDKPEEVRPAGVISGSTAPNSLPLEIIVYLQDTRRNACEPLNLAVILSDMQIWA
jgi:hypothetical protein